MSSENVSKTNVLIVQRLDRSTILKLSLVAKQCCKKDEVFRKGIL